MANERHNQVRKCILSGKLEELKKTKDLDEILKAKDNKGRTVLIAAAHFQCPHKSYSRCIELVLQMGADPTAADFNGDTAAHVAARCGNLQMLALLQFEAKFLPNREGCTPLMEAVQKGRFRCVKHLLHLFRQKRYFSRKKSLLDRKNKQEMSAIDIARAMDRKHDIRKDIVAILENEFRLSVNDEGKIIGQSSEELKLFEKMKHLAMEGNSNELLQLATRVHCDLPDHSGRTVLSWAAETDISPLKSMQLTLHALAELGDPTAADVNGDTSLHFAALRSKIHAARLLVELGVPVNTRDAHQQTPAMWASTPPSQVNSTVLTLVDMGADISLEDSEGRTALMLSKSSTSNPALSTLMHTTRSSSPTNGDENAPSSATVRRSESIKSASRGNFPNFLTSILKPLIGSRSRSGQSSSLRRGGSTASSGSDGTPENCFCYNSTSPGLMAILNICNYKDTKKFTRRVGSNSDVKSLKKMADELNLKVVEAHDKSADEMRTTLDGWAKDSSKLEQHGCFICVIMAHGKNGKIAAKDGKKLQVNEIVDTFNSTNCPALRHKPKVFIIQACRGGRMDIYRTVGENTDAGASGAASSYCPVESDILTCYATTEGSVAYRGNTEEEGSPFIQTLCKVIMEFHRTKHLLDMLTIVNRRLKRTPIKGPQGDCYAVSQTVTQLSMDLYL